MDEETWHGLSAHWREAAGDFDSFAVSERRPISRSGFMVLLLRRDRPTVFVKVRQNLEGLERELQALERVAAFGPETFAAPVPLGVGNVQDWSYLAMRAFEPGIHKMPRKPSIERIAAEISNALEGLSKPEGTQDDWRPMHGDFTPWNLRRTAGGRLILVDWEYASWAPPRADEVLYHATVSMVKREDPPMLRAPEAVAFWRRQISERAGHYGKGFTEALLVRMEDQARRTNAEGTTHNAPDRVQRSLALRRR